MSIQRQYSSMDSHYLYLTSDDSKDRFSHNKSDDFTVELSKPLQLEGSWEIGLIEANFSGTVRANSYYICSDVCAESQVSDKLYPVLRRVTVTKSKKTTVLYDTPIYVKVNRSEIQRLRVFIRDAKLAQFSLLGKTFACTLHLRKTTR